MKKLLTLILCWLLAFSAMAETTFKAYSSASVAGGYVTSLNKVDGSFEDVISQWVASVGTIVKTASTEMQGNNIGVWSGTGAGTLDLQWTATASNTYEASAQVDVQGEDDVYVCAYVGTTETGCKLIPALSKIQKVSVVADSVLGSAFYLRLKHTGSDAFNVKTDDGKIEPWTPQSIGVVEQESVVYSGYTSKSGNSVLFKTKDTARSNEAYLLSVTNSGYTKFTFLKPCKFSASAGYAGSSSGQVYLTLKNSSATTVLESTDNTAAGQGVAVLHGTASAGDFLFVEATGTPADSYQTNFSITASAISENVIQSYAPSEFLGELRFLPQNIAPKGFIPAMGSSIGKSSGTYQGDAYYELYKLLWTQSSVTAGEPYVISSTKGSDALTDWNAAKTITIDVSGLFVRAYKSGTSGAVGAKQLDAFQGHRHQQKIATGGSGSIQRYNATILSDLSSTALSGAYTDTPSDDGTNGTPRVASETRPTNLAQYAFIRYGNSAPDLIALPTSQINNYSAEISSAYTVVNGSENVSWISSITNPSTGIARITVKTDVVNPLALNIQITPKMSGTGNYNFYAQVSDVTSTYIDVRTGYTSGSTTAFSAYPFFINLEKRGSDYKAPGVFVGNVAKNQVAIVEYRGNSSNITLSGTAKAMPTNTVTGDSGIVSVGASSFTLQSGEYELDAGAIHYLYGGSTGSIQVESYIYNTTDNVETKRALPSYSYAYYATAFTVNPRLLTRVTITKQTTFEFRHRVVSTTNFTGYLGFAFASPNDINGYVKITKLNGQ